MVGIRTTARHRTHGPTRAKPKWKRPMSIFDLSGRAAVITGGNGGIGRGIAQALAAAGCNVSIWGRNTDKNSNAAATMAGCAGKVDTRICDVSEPSDFGGIAVYLMSKASSYHTADCFVIDGGYTAF